jgi:FolB domain-containing protein
MSMDKIVIRDLSVECIIGVNPEERQQKQTVLINIEAVCRLSPGTTSDCITDTLDYKQLNADIIAAAEQSSYTLIEALASAIADICLQYARITAVTVTVDKPGVLQQTRSVAVQVTRTREA